MKKKVYVQLLGATVLALILGCTSVMAKQSTENIQVSYNNIKMVVNGVPVEPKDANGSKIEPFIYNGTTYLPVRAVGDAFGQQVTWDGNTKTVYIGEVSNRVQYLMEVCPPYETDYGYYSANSDIIDGSNVFSMSGNTYTHGFMVDINRSNSTTALFNLNGKYETLKFVLGHVDNTGNDSLNLKIYLDGSLSKVIQMDADEMPMHIEVPLESAMQLKIEATGTEAIMWGSHYGLADMQLS